MRADVDAPAGRPARPAGSPRKAGTRGTRGQVVGPVGGGGDLRLRPQSHPRPRSTPSTPLRPPCRAPSTSATCSPTPRPTPSPASGACGARPSSTPWVGTTTACPPSGGCRTTSASAATRPCPSTPTSSRRTSPPTGPVSVSRRNFVALCHQLTAEDEQVFEAAVAHRSACRSTGPSTYTTISERAQRASQRGFLRLIAGGEAYASAPHRPCGTSTSGRPCPRPSSRTASGPAPTTGFGSPGPAATVRSRSRRPGPSCCRPVWPSSPIPTTIATVRSSAPRS